MGPLGSWAWLLSTHQPHFSELHRTFPLVALHTFLALFCLELLPVTAWLVIYSQVY